MKKIFQQPPGFGDETRSFKHYLASFALVTWMATQTASAVTTLDFVPVQGDQKATGLLLLSDPLDVWQTPLAGSFFDLDGQGPIPSFDLTPAPGDPNPFEWREVGGKSGLVGHDISSKLTLTIIGVGLPGDIPEQFYQVTFPVLINGNGNWVPRIANGVPDGGASLTLFAMSLAGLGLAGRRWRPVVL
jgi:hypothetical protein